LIEKLKKFEEENWEMIENPEKISDEFVLKCKQFMRELHFEGNEGSFLDIFSFWKEKKYSNLKKIFEIADIHSENVDKLINQAIWDEHLRNNVSNGKNAQ
jgi:CTP:phosphocholine cytidylyltransferase-like protein